MKTNFNIELDLGELFCDDETSVQEIVKREIASSVVAEVKMRVKQQISDMIDVSIKESIDKHIDTLAREIMIKKFDENAEIKENNYSDRKRPVQELCSLYFAEAIGRNNLESKMKDYCKSIAE